VSQAEDAELDRRVTPGDGNQEERPRRKLHNLLKQ
jgi:hypothetical protein